MWLDLELCLNFHSSRLPVSTKPECYKHGYAYNFLYMNLGFLTMDQTEKINVSGFAELKSAIFI
jgi:hypothetical protein